MKKLCKHHKIIAFLLSVTVFLIFPSNVFATDSLPCNITKTANDFLVNVLHREPYDEFEYLINVHGEIAYALFTVNSGGYVIIDMQNGEVMEGSPDSHPYFNDKNATYCYNGPLNYYQKYNDSFFHFATQQLYAQNEIVPTHHYPSDVQTTNNYASSRATGDYTRRLSGNLKNISWSSNPSTACPAFAAAIFLLYYDDYLYPNAGYVPHGYIGVGAVYFPDYLATGGFGLDGPRSPSATQQGIQNYLNSQGVNKTMTCIAYTGTRYKNQINSNKPVIVGLDNDPQYGNHWVVGYGYYVERDPNVSYLIVNDCQGRPNVHINPAYVDYLIY